MTKRGFGPDCHCFRDFFNTEERIRKQENVKNDKKFFDF